MRQLLGLLRFLATIAVISMGIVLMIITGLLRLRRRNLPMPSWILQAMSRLFNAIFNVHVHCAEPEILRTHQGFVTPNHVSYLDIIGIYAITPVRFLSAIEVKQRPVLGWLAEQARTVFVDRASIRSRRNAVNAIVDAYRAYPDPPIVIFPEGRLGNGRELYPFQLGTFKMARNNGISFLPCAIRYDRPDIAVWHGRLGESMLAAVWRLATFPGPLHMEIIPLEVVHPADDDSAAELADDAHYAIETVMGFAHTQGVINGDT